ncbi:MAG: type II secretion system protein [Candidatus Gracilibacteria bacterium]|nr:type II secretion system protein [Candidatus Gracilibacteria bacterium]
MKKSNKAFTLVELIVVITILAILGTIAFINLQGYSISARDGKRVSDINNIMKKIGIEIAKGTSISTLINTTKTNTGLTIDGNNTSTSIQGTASFLNLKEDGNNFKDPVTKGDYVFSYSVGGTGTGAYKFIQASTVNEELSQAVVKGNYYLMQTGDSPSIILTTVGATDYYVVDEGIDLPYEIIVGISENNVVVNSCDTQPSYTNAIFTIGTPISENEIWQNTNNANPCYYECTGGYTGNDCSIAPTIGMNLSTTPGESVYYAGVYTGGHGNAMAVAGTQGIYAWKTTNTATDIINAINATDGRVNTQAIIAVDPTLVNHPSTKYCNDLVWGGFDDWYVPAIAYGVNATLSNCENQPGEAQFLFCKHRGNGTQSLLGFIDYSWYSTSYDVNTFYGNFRFQVAGNSSDGAYQSANKTVAQYVRCVRVIN